LIVAEDCRLNPHHSAGCDPDLEELLAERGIEVDHVTL
jgi:hypothetical protein